MCVCVSKIEIEYPKVFRFVFLSHFVLWISSLLSKNKKNEQNKKKNH